MKKRFYVTAVQDLVHVVSTAGTVADTPYTGVKHVFAVCGGWSPVERVTFIESPTTCLECIARES